MDDIAIIGMACRLPGAPDLHAYWDLLRTGGLGLGPVPPERWTPEALERLSAGTTRPVPKEGGFIPGIDQFDAEAFRLSDRETATMDPQHRMLLEVAWEAIEDAGLPFGQIHGANAAVYLGVFTSDFREQALMSRRTDLDVYFEVGTTRSSGAGRISHTFGLTGPAGVVDAACASSLLAIHLACQSLRTREAEFAIAGGSNLLLTPEPTASFHRSGMLSSDARCRFGDAAADGFVRSEGAALLVLKRRADAEAAGDRIWALIRRSAAANDGRTGDGHFMTPSREGQANLLRRAWEGLDRTKLAFIECHGTGTRAGDPVETGAIADVLSRQTPLLLGSVKSNIGHTEGAAGAAGTLKAALALHHRQLPATLGLRKKNPEIPWEEARLEINTDLHPLPEDGELLAGVSSFGLSGTDAHLILASAPPPTPSTTPAAPTPAGGFILPVSAHSRPALAARLRDLAIFLENEQISPADLSYTLGSRREALPIRLAVAGRDRAQLVENLQNAANAFTSGEPGSEELGNELLSQASPTVAFVCSGQGGQWADMGKSALFSDPTFFQSFSDFDREVQAQAGWSPLRLLTGPADAWINRIEYIQPLLCGFQIALSAFYAVRGLQPAAVVGHSLGEVAAATIAGALDLSDAVRVICARSAAMARAPGQGGMAVVPLSPAQVEPLLAKFGGALEIAVHNAPGAVVIAGDRAALDKALTDFSAMGLECRRVDVEVASHSPQMQALVEPLGRALTGLKPGPSRIPFWSATRAASRPGTELGPQHWQDNLRGRVRFAETIPAMVSAGIQLFVELSPHGVLLHPLQSTLPPGTAFAGPRRDDPSVAGLGETLAALWTAGVAFDWAMISGSRHLCSTPAYPFQRTPVAWATAPQETQAAGHPLLGTGSRREAPLDSERFPWLLDHKVRENPLFPGAGFVEAMRAAAAEALPGDGLVLEKINLVDWLAIPNEPGLFLRTELEEKGPDAVELRVLSQSHPHSAEASPARLHAHAQARRLPPPRSAEAGPEAGERLQAHLRICLNRRTKGAAVGILCLPCPRHQRATLDQLQEICEPSERLFGLNGQVIVVLSSLAGPAAFYASFLRFHTYTCRGTQGPKAGQGPCGRLLTGDDRPNELWAACLEKRLPQLMVAPQPSGHLSGEAFYQTMSSLGIGYGPAFQGITELDWWTEEKSLPTFGDKVAPGTARYGTATIELPSIIRGDQRFGLHPALLDILFQAAVGPALGSERANETRGFLPIGLDRLKLFAPLNGRLRLHSFLRGEEGLNPGELRVDFLVEGAPEDPRDEPDGSRPPLLLTATGLRVRRFQGSQADPLGWIHRWAWVELPPNEATPLGKRALILADQLVEGEILAHHLRRLGGEIEVRPLQHPELPGLRPDQVLILPRADGDPGEASAAQCVRLAQAFTRLEGAYTPAPSVGVLSHGAWALDPMDLPDPAAASAWGLARVAARELPHLQIRLLDLPQTLTSQDWQTAARAITSANREDECAIRDARLFGHRLRAEPGNLPGPERADRRPDLDWAFSPLTGEKSPPRAVRAEARGLLRRKCGIVEAGFGWWLAEECHANAETSDTRTTGVETGGAEAGWGQKSHSQLARAQTGQLEGRPGAEPPLYLCLGPSPSPISSHFQPELRLRVPRETPSDTQNIGESLTWRRLVRAYGATLLHRLKLALAGVPTGATLVFDGPPLAATEALRQLIEEGGFQAIVLQEEEQPNPADHRLGKNFLGQFSRNDPERYEVIADLCGAAAAWVLFSGAPDPSGDPPLLWGAPILDLRDPNRIRRSWRGGPWLPLAHALPDPQFLHEHLARPAAAHEGQAESISIHLPGEIGPTCGPAGWDLEPREGNRRPIGLADRINPTGSWLITGGLGALGLAFAERLVAAGLRHLVLVGRRADPRDPRLAGLRAAGATVEVEAQDITDGLAVHRLVSRFGVDWPRLDGVAHLAAVLDDATLPRIQADNCARVMRPKVLGAIHLDMATRAKKPAHFLLFSSAAGALGSPGQGAYAAANTFLDALAEKRRNEGLPAQSVQWGVWGEVGLAVAAGNRADRLQERGLLPMATGAALDLLERTLLGDPSPVLGIFSIQWDRWARAFPAIRDQGTFRELLPETTAEVGDPWAGLLQASLSEQAIRLEDLLRGEIAQVLRVAPSRVRPRRPLSELGMDSLMTVELLGRLRARLPIELPPGKVFGSSTLEALTQTLLRSLAAIHREEADPEADLHTERVLSLPDLRREALSGPTSEQTTVTIAPTQRWMRTFLTGATGFLGAHLLRELLDHQRGTVAVLVRAPDMARARARLREALAGQGIWRQGDEARIEPVLGDLAAADLGISHEQRRFLAQGIQDIYHCGANVQHAKAWTDLAPANVEGTASILRLGALAGARVHHISSIAVFPFSLDPQAGRRIEESTRVGRQAEPFFGDYAETKRAAEELVEQARKQGVDARIYRLGLVTGSNQQALCPADDAIWRAVQGIAAVRAFPQLRGTVSLSPVDGVARGIRVLAQRNDPKSTWHLVSPDAVGAEDLSVALQAVGLEARPMPSRVWQRLLEEQITREMAIYPILPKLQMLDLEALDQSTQVLLADHTWACLDAETRTALRMDRSLLSRYLASLQDRGALPSPWGGPSEG